MKAINYFILRSVFAIAIGLLLVFWPETAINYLVITIGVLFFIPGLISLIAYFTQKKEVAEKYVFPIAGLGSVLFGIWLMIMPGFFVTILMYILGFILVLGGIQQIVSLVSARKSYKISAGYYVVPVLILIAGLIVLLNPFSVASAAFIMLGITSIVYGLSDLFNGIRFKRKSTFRNELPMD